MLHTPDPGRILETVRKRLEAEGALSPNAWERAVSATQDVGERIDRAIVKLGLASEENVADALAETFDLPRLTQIDAPPTPFPLGSVSPIFLAANRVAPLALDADGRLRIAIADPFDPFPREALSKAFDCDVAPVLGLDAEIDTLIARLYAGDAPDEYAPVAAADDVERLRDLASEAPIIQLVNASIEAAVRAGASDLHFERGEEGLRVRRRIDGRLYDDRTLPLDQAQAIVSRLKIMARLDIAERRLPAGRPHPDDERRSGNRSARLDAPVARRRSVGAAHSRPRGATDEARRARS